METVYVFTPPISGRRVVFGERERRTHEEGARREEASNVLHRERESGSVRQGGRAVSAFPRGRARVRRYQLRSNAADGRSWRRRARGSKFAIPLTFLHFLACVGGRASALESK